MKTERDNLIGEYITKSVQARASMWSAMSNVFGFIISAASIVSALSKPVWWLLLPILLASFWGIMALVRCFRLVHHGYIDIIDGLAKPDQPPDGKKLAAAIEEIRKPDPVHRSECLAIVLLWISAILFFAQAIKTFC
jgi:hypothetical protein